MLIFKIKEIQKKDLVDGERTKQHENSVRAKNKISAAFENFEC